MNALSFKLKNVITIMVFAVIFMGAFNCDAQTPDPEPGFPYPNDELYREPKKRIVRTKVEIEAEYPGGRQGFKEFLLKNLNSRIANANGAKEGQYTVIVRFIVKRNGRIKGVHTETIHGFGMEDEAIRVIKLTRRWIPGQQNGVRVDSYKRLPITFSV